MSGQVSGPGRPPPPGATPRAGGTDFALLSGNATQVTLCLFEGGRETRHVLPHRDGEVWHGHIPGVGPGAQYGFRVHGPWAPAEGHRFNPAKLLLDPWARMLTGRIVAHPDQWGGADAPDPRDSAPTLPRCVVTAPLPPADPFRPADDLVIWEGHVRGATMRLPGVGAPGTFAAMASPPMLDHLTRLGVTAVELLPVQAFLDDAFAQARGLTNFWGYQPVCLMAPEPRFLSRPDPEELRAMVAAFHGAGIAVILDIVANHTGEGDETGPTLAFRGIDNAGYYRLTGGSHVNDTGCGNTLDAESPLVVRLVMDSLRHWVQGYGVDGFRFDLATVLGRGRAGFRAEAPLLTAIRQDPVLSRCILIAEPWDLGPGGYRLGDFPAPFREWNDRFRDALRRFWRGDPGAAPAVAAGLAGSADRFDRNGRRPTASVNYVTAHDGMTLADLTMYARPRNHANGEEGRDGHGDNLSDPMGPEGPSDDPVQEAARAARRRAMLASVILGQGTPMLLGGDESGNSQGGNSNAWAQDNPTGWLDWGPDEGLAAFVAQAIALRRARAELRQPRFLHGEARGDGTRTLVWRRADGAEMTPPDWQAPGLALVIAEIRLAEGGGRPVLLVLNAGAQVAVTLPPGGWRCDLDSARPGAAPGPAGPVVRIAAQSVAVFTGVQG